MKHKECVQEGAGQDGHGEGGGGEDVQVGALHLLASIANPVNFFSEPIMLTICVIFLFIYLHQNVL
jgi:hypothetical protein